MSPLALKVLMHYYVTPQEFDRRKAHRLELDAIQQFLEDDLLQERTGGKHDEDAYRITDKGSVYCRAILNLPLPVKKVHWEIPSVVLHPVNGSAGDER